MTNPENTSDCLFSGIKGLDVGSTEADINLRLSGVPGAAGGWRLVLVRAVVVLAGVDAVRCLSDGDCRLGAI